MDQIIEQITALRTPVELSGFINGRTVAITGDNPNDPLHLNKEVSLKIYDRHEIAAGQSRYQIARQPRFTTSDKILGDRRGDLMLLVNGMPVIHLELKKSGISVRQAGNQIKKYMDQGVFTGIFSLVQVFVAMTPEETEYFANPGPDGEFTRDFFFHWADFNNVPINEWTQVVEALLTIPMAHELIGYYTVADQTDGILKVMRSYQYYAAKQIWSKVAKTDWEYPDQRGGYVWHTTGSGKTLTSFKAAQLIAASKDADKVIFLMDRVELGTQSLREYRGFAGKAEDVQATENTHVLVSKLKSNNPSDTLIVTSIQKLSLVGEDAHLKAADLRSIQNKRIVIIIDEAHRSTFGDMLMTIKNTFPDAIMFGFTGTPIQDENQKKKSTTATIFGDELHRYSIADGIRDQNVLGFDTYLVNTYDPKRLRKHVALEKANASTETEALDDPAKKKIYLRYMDSDQVPQAGEHDAAGNWIRGIEDNLPSAQYNRDEHREMVVHSIAEDWNRLSQNSKFHAILATSSIEEAIRYYRLFKAEQPQIRTAILVDPSLDNTDGVKFKQDGLVELLKDYNATFDKEETLSTFARYKKDVANRLSHKKPYLAADLGDQRLDLLIVVDQMLTGFDSKWVNTLYLDKVMESEYIIQAFSRTNRLFGHDKPFGTIKYYRKPATMKKNIERAVELYSGHAPRGLFVDKLGDNIKAMNATLTLIENLFLAAGVRDFQQLPDDPRDRAQFAQRFSELSDYLEAALIQGFHWDRLTYQADNAEGVPETVTLSFNQNTYLTLALRYKELVGEGGGGGNDGDGPSGEATPTYALEGHLIEIDTGKINSDYLDSKFEKYIKALENPDVGPEEVAILLSELHSSFATLSQEEQKFAKIFLADISSGEAQLEEGKTFRDYVHEYQRNTFEENLRTIVQAFGVDETLLRKLLTSGVIETNLNEYGRFDDLRNSADKVRARQYFEWNSGTKASDFRLNIELKKMLQNFILTKELPAALEEYSI